jgi:hypothetical protein
LPCRFSGGFKYVVDTQSKVVQAKREGRQEKEREIARAMKANHEPR